MGWYPPSKVETINASFMPNAFPRASIGCRASDSQIKGLRAVECGRENGDCRVESSAHRSRRHDDIFALRAGPGGVGQAGTLLSRVRLCSASAREQPT